MSILANYNKKLESEYKSVLLQIEYKSNETKSQKEFFHWFLNGEINEKLKFLLSGGLALEFKLSDSDYILGRDKAYNEHYNLMLKFYDLLDKKE